jgi:hypothetical protein
MSHWFEDVLNRYMILESIIADIENVRVNKRRYKK